MSELEELIFKECVGGEITREDFQREVYGFREQHLELFGEEYLFDTNGQRPYSEELDQLFERWILAGRLISSSSTNNKYHSNSQVCVGVS